MVDDPYFIVDPKGLLRRYLVAARFDVREAIIRLEATWSHSQLQVELWTGQHNIDAGTA